jgi:hypothetical protein
MWLGSFCSHSVKHGYISCVAMPQNVKMTMEVRSRAVGDKDEGEAQRPMFVSRMRRMTIGDDDRGQEKRRVHSGT